MRLCDIHKHNTAIQVTREKANKHKVIAQPKSYKIKVKWTNNETKPKPKQNKCQTDSQLFLQGLQQRNEDCNIKLYGLCIMVYYNEIELFTVK